jgi:hypothetical protein
MTYAFRCRTCGHLETPAAAGREPQPHACPVCGRGVHFSATGQKVTDPHNWERLADATPARLAELGLAAADVCAHAPHAHADDLARDAADCRAAADLLLAKRGRWEREQAALARAHARLGAELDALPEEPEDRATAERRQRVRHERRELENAAWTGRDAAHLAALEARLLHGPAPRNSPKQLLARATEAAAGAAELAARS